MVPGITERERRAVEMRRITWLSDAVLGPARIGQPLPTPPTLSTPRSRLPAGWWRRGLALARWLGQRIDLLLSAPGTGRVRRATPLTR